jgi:hypothetical protein
MAIILRLVRQRGCIRHPEGNCNGLATLPFFFGKNNPQSSRKDVPNARAQRRVRAKTPLKKLIDRFILGLVPLTFRSLNSFRLPFVRRPRGFCLLTMNDAVVDYRTH